MRTLGDLVLPDRTLTQPDRITTGTRHVALEHMGPFGVLEWEVVTENSVPRSTKAVFAADQILYGKLRPYLNKVAIAPFSGVASTEILALTVLHPNSPRYVFHLMRCANFVRYATTRSAGANLPRVSAEVICAFEVPVHDPDMQGVIAASLDQVLRTRIPALAGIETAERLVSALFLETFGDPVENPNHHPMCDLGDLCGPSDIVDGPFGSSLKPECYVGAGVRVVRNVNVRDNAFDGSEFKYVSPQKYAEIARSSVSPQDLLLTIKGSVGRVCVMPELEGPSVLSASGTARIRLPDRVMPGFASSQMATAAYQRYLQSFIAGTNQQYLNLSAIKRLRLLVPPLDIQQRFVAALDDIRALKAKLQASLAEVEALYDALSHQYFGAP